MKKLLMFGCTLLFSIFSHSQESGIALDSIATVKSPNAFAFQELNFLQTNEYTGRAQIDIPIWNIDLGDISIPISISYNTGGVKVNTVAGDVGLNWSLNAGGVITKQIKGDNDFSFDLVTSGSSAKGFLMDGAFGNHPAIDTDGKPDIYTAIAPGINTVFVHRKDRTPLEIDKKGTEITSSTVNDDTSYSMHANRNDFKDISLRSTSGFKYDFFARDSIWYDRYLIPQNWQGDLENGFGIGNCLVYGGSDGDPTTGNDAVSNSDCYGLGYYNSHYLTKVTDVSTGNKVLFNYDKYFVDDFELRRSKEIHITNSPNYNVSEYRVEVDSWFNRIREINYKNTNIYFIYSTVPRIDIPGSSGKSLTAIEIKDNRGNLIKRANFVYDYTQSIENCTDPECYRLRLKEVYFSYSGGVKEPSYVFTYNNLELPKRFSYKKDFFGFHNGATATSSPEIPKVYYYPKNGRLSVLPFELGTQYFSPFSSFNMNPNFGFTSAQSIEQIRFPSGGTLELTYEPHAFLLEGYEKEGGGLRIHKQTFKDNGGVIEKEILYNYSDNGLTSGSIVQSPRFADVRLASSSSSTFFDPNIINWQNANGKVSFRVSLDDYSTGGMTNNSYVGYNRVSVEESGNGSRELKFTSPKEVNNNYPTQFTFGNVTSDHWSGSEKTKWLDFKISNGIFPNIFLDNDIKRGSLLEEKVYTSTGELLRKMTYNYTYSEFESLQLEDKFLFFGLKRNRPFSDQTYVETSLSYYSKRNLLTSTVEQKYLNGGLLTNTTNIIYDSNYPFVKETHYTVDTDDYIIKNYYPFDSEVSNQQNINNLYSQNRLSQTILTENYVNNFLLARESYSYADFNGKYFIDKVLTSKGANNLLEDMTIDLRDSEGNILQYHDIHNSYTSVIWGYNKSYPIAKISGKQRSSINTQVIDNLMDLADQDDDNSLDYTGKEGALRLELDNLRDLFPDAMISTYTYDPLIGITSTTGPSRISQFFVYDEHNRLAKTLDKNLNMEQELNYNFKTPNNNTIEPNPPINSVNIIRSYDFNSGINSFVANIDGGVGPYTFDWNYTINGQTTNVQSNTNSIDLSFPFNETVSVNLDVTDSSSTVSENYTFFNGCHSYSVKSINYGQGNFSTISYTDCSGQTMSVVSSTPINICIVPGTEIYESTTPVFNGNCN